MFDFTKLISSDYLFSIDTVLLHRSDKLLLVIGIALVVVGIVARLTSRFAPHQFAAKIWRRVSTLTLTIGILEIIWFGARYENIRVFGTHAAAFLVLLVGVVWLVPIAKYRFWRYRSDIESWNKEQVKQKYLQM